MSLDSVTGGGSTSGSESSTSESSASAPTDTASIAASVMAEMEGSGSGGNDSGDDSGGDSTEAVAATADGDAAAETVAADPDDFDAIPAKVADALGRERENKLPHSRVSEMIAKKVAKEKAAWDAEIAPIRDEVTTLKSQLAEVNGIEAIMTNEPDRYIQMLAMVNPAYQKFAAVLQAAQSSQQSQPAVDAADPEPEPDLDLGNGQMTYSRQGMAKLREWDRRQAIKEAEGKFEGRLKPIEAERQAAAERQRLEAVRTQAMERVTQTLEKARKWPQFAENEQAIQAALVADKTLDLHDAYIQVVFPKMAGERTALRAEVLAEINALPKTTSAATTASAIKPPTGPKTTADVAREVMRELGEK